MKSTKANRTLWLLLGIYATIIAGVIWAVPSTETVVSLTTGLKVGGADSDRIGFFAATPTPKPIITGAVTAANLEAALAALGLVATATPTSTPTPTPTP